MSESAIPIMKNPLYWRLSRRDGANVTLIGLFPARGTSVITLTVLGGMITKESRSFAITPGCTVDIVATESGDDICRFKAGP
jgi:hypothetical protein